tara:strand:+ start:308 stop:1468 length:1161 start_codon:yes stop_codon:yes gene_type:complete
MAFDLASLALGGIIEAHALCLDQDNPPYESCVSLYELSYGADIDLSNAFGWKGWVGRINVLSSTGAHPNDQVDSLFGVSSIEIPDAILRVDQAWVEYTGIHGAWLVGLYPIDTEFMALNTASTFVNPAYGPVGDLSLTDTPSVFPTSSFGVRYRHTLDDKNSFIAIAVLDGVAGNTDKPTETTIDFNSGDGLFYIGEIGAGIPVRNSTVDVLVGAWGYTRSREKWTNSGEDLVSTGSAKSRGAYVSAETTMALDSGKGLSVFARYSQNWGGTVALKSAYSFGVLVDWAPNNPAVGSFGASFSRGQSQAPAQVEFSTQSLQGPWHRHDESVFEIGQGFQLTSDLLLRPFFQAIKNPGGGQPSNVAVIGLQLRYQIGDFIRHRRVKAQ